MIILSFAFGTIVAMGMPILSAIIGLLAGLSLIGLMGHVLQVPDIAPTLAIMIGLGVGIDYALFLVSRHRYQVEQGMDVRESIALSVGKTGSAIVFAGGTVVIALLALAVAGHPARQLAGLRLGRRRRHGRAGRDHPAPRAAVPGRPAHRVAGAPGVHAPQAASRPAPASGTAGRAGSRAIPGRPWASPP